LTITLVRELVMPAREAAPRELGPGSTVFCAAGKDSVATARHIFPDRRIEVKTLFVEPNLGAAGSGFPSLSLLRWMVFPPDGADSAEETRRRVVDVSVQLIARAKESGDAVLVAGPVLLRLLAFKLNAIGFTGGFLLNIKPGERRPYRYRL
jgi:hypothetical protein